MTCKLQYLERKPHQPWHWFSCGFSILVELEFRVLVFEMGGKLEKLEKNSWSKARTNNKLNPHIARN